MTPQQIELVQESFALVAPGAEAAAAVFYERLFALDSALRRMFPAVLTEQKKKLMQTLKLAVESLKKLDALAPALESLGRKHAAYGVGDQHYETVGAALLWTLRRQLGAQFTPEIETAWAETYALVAGTMKRAAQSPAEVFSAA